MDLNSTCLYEDGSEMTKENIALYKQTEFNYKTGWFP